MLQVGQLVVSRQGRDKDRPYLVLGFIDRLYVNLVDGDIRRLDRPKRKNIKHLQFTRQVARDIAQRLQNGEKVTNADIRQAIARLLAQLAEEKEKAAKTTSDPALNHQANRT
ncbi:MAG: KOW domain-containing RNA-binding protein [Clostridia bacterium]|nr:KOW domain-containing RNA-binding protein [Clostridia bacterium]